MPQSRHRNHIRSPSSPRSTPSPLHIGQVITNLFPLLGYEPVATQIPKVENGTVWTLPLINLPPLSALVFGNHLRFAVPQVINRFSNIFVVHATLSKPYCFQSAS